MALRPAARPSSAALLLASRRQARSARRQQAALASMGLGFHPEPVQRSQELLLPDTPDYGLSVKQMQVLGLTNDGSFATARPEVKAVSGGRRRAERALAGLHCWAARAAAQACGHERCWRSCWALA